MANGKKVRNKITGKRKMSVSDKMRTFLGMKALGDRSEKTKKVQDAGFAGSKLKSRSKKKTVRGY